LLKTDVCRGFLPLIRPVNVSRIRNMRVSVNDTNTCSRALQIRAGKGDGRGKTPLPSFRSFSFLSYLLCLRPFPVTKRIGTNSIYIYIYIYIYITTGNRLIIISFIICVHHVPGFTAGD
jgi:hypothetical protein